MACREKGSTMQQGTPLVEAAEIFGVTADSLRKRARRGTVKAYKQGDEWYVIVPNGTDRPQANGQATSQATARASQATREPLEEVVAVVITTLREQLQIKDRQIAEKDMQLSERDRQLAAREREVSELHVLLQTTQRLIPSVTTEMIESPVSQGKSTPEPVQPDFEASLGKQEVSWWRRIFLGEV